MVLPAVSGRKTHLNSPRKLLEHRRCHDSFTGSLRDDLPLETELLSEGSEVLKANLDNYISSTTTMKVLVCPPRRRQKSRYCLLQRTLA